MPIAVEWWTTAFAVVYVLYRISGFIAAGHAILNVRASQSSIAWAMALAFFPMVGLPLYFLLGSRRFTGYVQSRRRGKLAIQQVAKELAPKLKNYMLPKSGIPDHLYVMQFLAKLPFTKGNHCELLVNGGATYDSLLRGIAEAKSYILFQFFTIQNNKTGYLFRDKLLEKAKQGVKVFIIIDPLGSGDLPSDFFAELRAAGAEKVAFNDASWRNRFRLNFRNHRKIVVVDGHTAWVGGLNIGDSYLGHGSQFSHWRDTHLMIQGPVVLPIQLTFLEDWYWAARTIPPLCWDPKPVWQDAVMALVIPSGPSDYLDTYELFILQLIHQSKSRFWITSPYFVPNDTVMSALQLAALRGVDVRVLIPETPDHFLVYLSAFTFLQEADKAGVKIYRYQPGFLHQKVMLIDEDQAVVGTANLDNRSMRINFEISILVHDGAFNSKVEKLLREDLNQCHEVDGDELKRKPLWFRLAARIARLMAPLQ